MTFPMITGSALC